MSGAARAVLFDLDNTLILEEASTFAAVRAAAELARTRGGDPDVVATAAVDVAGRLWRASPAFAYADAMGIWWGEVLWGGFTGDAPQMRALREFVPRFRDAVWRGALARAGVRDDALGAELARAYIAARRGGEAIDADAETVLGDLARDHRLGLVTNGAGDVQREKLARTELGRYFGAIVISAELGLGKPDPRLFARALDALGVAAADATMVGDSLLRDVAGARRAGMRTVWLDRRLWDEEGPEPGARIERLSDLPAVLDALERRPASPRATP